MAMGGIVGVSRRRLVVVAIGVGLALGVLAWGCRSSRERPESAPNTTPTSGRAAEPDEREVRSWLPHLEDSAKLRTSDVVQGTLVDENGRPTSGLVGLSAWPPPERLSQLKPGDRVPTGYLAKAVAGNDGRFTLRIAPEVDVDPFLSPYGTMNFDLVASRDDRHGNTTSSASRRQTDSGGAEWVDPISKDPVRDVRVELDRP
jgi:hypothetical protein